MGGLVYETIGAGYTRHRKAEPRLVQQVLQHLALPQGSRILDVGAGTGNYASALAAQGYRVIALEPAALMRRQAGHTAGVHWIAGKAEALPLVAGAADGAICMLALHHMSCVSLVVQEMRRVVPDGPLVIFTFDPRLSEPYWFDAYFPTVWQEAFSFFPPLDEVIEQMRSVSGQPVEVASFKLPPDLVDRFASAGWRQPDIYLDPIVRSGTSPFALSDQNAVEAGVARLASDLDSGAWHQQYGDLLQRETLDAGNRFLIMR